MPGGESMAELAERVGAWLAETPTDATTLAVAHHGVATVLLGLYRGLSPSETLCRHRSLGMAFRLTAGEVERLDVGETAH